MERLYEDINIEIRLDSLNKCIEYGLKQFVPSEEYKKLLEIIYDYSIQHSCNKNLVDMRDMKVIPEDVQEWMQSNWIPRMMEKGITKFALINTKSVITQMTVGKIEEGVRKIGDERAILTTYFDNLEEARSWIANN